MTRSIGSFRILVTIVALAILVGVIALPVLAADPSGSPSPAASEPTDSAGRRPRPPNRRRRRPRPPARRRPRRPPPPWRPRRPQSRPRPLTTATATAPRSRRSRPSPTSPTGPTRSRSRSSGTVGTRTDDDGDVEYTLTNGTTVLVLDAGPSWFYGDDHPLKAARRQERDGRRRAGSRLERGRGRTPSTASRFANRASRPGPVAGRSSARSTGLVAEKAERSGSQAGREGRATRHDLLAARPLQGRARRGQPERREPARRLTAAVWAS